VLAEQKAKAAITSDKVEAVKEARAGQEQGGKEKTAKEVSLECVCVCVCLCAKLSLPLFLSSSSSFLSPSFFMMLTAPAFAQIEAEQKEAENRRKAQKNDKAGKLAEHDKHADKVRAKKP
jgi:hypothetical protein